MVTLFNSWKLKRYAQYFLLSSVTYKFNRLKKNLLMYFNDKTTTINGESHKNVIVFKNNLIIFSHKDRKKVKILLKNILFLSLKNFLFFNSPMYGN